MMNELTATLGQVNWSLGLQTATTIVAAVAAYFAGKSAKATKGTAQGQLFYELLRRYSSEEMHAALAYIGEIASHRKRGNDEFRKGLERYAKGKGLYSHPKWEATEVDRFRRPVSHFFLTALELYDHNQCLDKGFLQGICGLDGFRLFYEVVEWLEAAKNPKYDRRAFDRLLELCGRDDMATLRKVRPPEHDQE